MKATYKTMVVFILIIVMASIVFISGCAKEKVSDTAMDKTPLVSPVDTLESTLPISNAESKKLTANEVISRVGDSKFLEGVHHKQNVDCKSCHGEIIDNKPAKIPTDDLCLSCHGENYDALTEKLAVKEEWKEINPHNPAHERESCITCHRSHQSFELTCSTCHTVRAPERFH